MKNTPGRSKKQLQSENPHVAKLAYSMREAAVALGVSYITIHRLLKRGLLRSSTVCRTKIIPASELTRLLATTVS